MKTVYECECGYKTHFEKALAAHCSFRRHKPKEDPNAAETPMVKEEPVIEEPVKTVKKTARQRKPKKAEAKE